MSEEQTKLEYAKWILERHLNWISAAEVKTGVVVAIDTAMLGALAAAFGNLKAPQRTPDILSITALAAGMLIIALICAAMTLLPRVSGPEISYVFFGRIAEIGAADYIERFKRTPIQTFLEDCLSQVHRNAEIARDKFGWVRKSMGWSFFAGIPWIAAMTWLYQH